MEQDLKDVIKNMPLMVSWSAFNMICIPYLHRCFLFSNLDKLPVRMLAVCSHMLSPSSMIQFWSPIKTLFSEGLETRDRRGWCHAQTNAELRRVCGDVTAVIYWMYGRTWFIPVGNTAISNKVAWSSQSLRLHQLNTFMRWTDYGTRKKKSKWLDRICSNAQGGLERGRLLCTRVNTSVNTEASIRHVWDKIWMIR